MSDQLVTILHVDDNEANRYIVDRMLRKVGFEVKEAATGKVGLRLAAEQQPDLIILDVKLPDISGFEVCRRIKANPATSSIPVLHLSASFVKSEDKVQGLEGGADGYLAQPVEPIELIATVNALLRIRQAEISVRNRTVELAKANEKLRSEITERKQAESALRQSEERLRLALEVARMSTWDWDLLTNQMTWSHNYESLFGLAPGTFGQSYESVLEYVHPQDRQSLIEAMTSCLEQKVCYDHEYRIVLPDGSIRWLAGKGQVFYDAIGTKAVRMIGITIDITQRKHTAEQIKASLQEKEVLLKEIHHRVKNNMQIICSLLNLQSTSISDPQILEILQEGQNRVASMALVHEQLYQSEDLARIDFAEYIQNLAANLISSYDVNSDAIALKIDVDHIHLSVDAAIPCGLIINELIANSLKYAFPLGESGEICIALHSNNDNQLLLSVSDNGIGLPPDLDVQNTETLGLQLVTALTEQLSGTIELNGNIGTEFKITFPAKSL